MNYRLHGIFQARTLKWVAFPFSRGSSQPRDQTQVSHIAGRFFTSWATRETLDQSIAFKQNIKCSLFNNMIPRVYLVFFVSVELLLLLLFASCPLRIKIVQTDKITFGKEVTGNAHNLSVPNNRDNTLSLLTNCKMFLVMKYTFSSFHMLMDYTAKIWHIGNQI